MSDATFLNAVGSFPPFSFDGLICSHTSLSHQIRVAADQFNGMRASGELACIRPDTWDALTEHQLWLLELAKEVSALQARVEIAESEARRLMDARRPWWRVWWESVTR